MITIIHLFNNYYQVWKFLIYIQLHTVSCNYTQGLFTYNTVPISHNCCQLILFKKPQFQIYRSRFSLVFSTYFLFFTQILVLFRSFLEAKLFSSPQKSGPHDQHQTLHLFQSHQQSIKLNDQVKLQSTSNKVSIFG